MTVPLMWGTSAVRKPWLSPTLAAKGGRAEHLIPSEDFDDFRDGSFRKAEGPKREREREKERKTGQSWNHGFHTGVTLAAGEKK